MICLQPFTPIYNKQEDYDTKVNRTSSSANSSNSTLSVASETSTMTDSTTETIINNNLHKVYMDRYRVNDGISSIEVYIKII